MGTIFDIKTEQVRLVYSAIPFSTLTIFINSTLLCIVLWSVTDNKLLFPWLAVTYLLSALRLGLYRKFKLTSPAPANILLWEKRLLITTVLSGLLWGMASLVLFPGDDIAHQVFLAFVVAGMSAGAVTTLSAHTTACLAFISLALLPVVLRFFSLGDSLGYTMAFMSALFLVMLMITSIRLNQTILGALEMRYRRQVAEATIQRQALYDTLTDLPNRRMFFDRLKQELARSQRHRHLGVVMFLDIDHFKKINDSLGHLVGDELLIAIADRLKGRLRDEDVIARLGGDEYVILVPDIGDALEGATRRAQLFAEELLTLIRGHFDIRGHHLHVTASIGITLFPLQQKKPEDLLQQADTAMYQAKKEGRNSACFFLPNMQEAANQRLSIEKGLHQALARDEFELYYQPQLDSHGTLIGAEALLRWHHPERGAVLPGEFIKIAEETGIILEIGEWVLRAACRAISALSLYHMTISVNVSPKQFKDPNFVERVNRALNDTGADPHRLRIEITESTVIDNIEQTIVRLQQLKRLGISFSIDDFGTGYSSLAYLKRLPVDVIKIDQSFVRDIETDSNDAAIVETIIVMAKHLGLGVVAEGVETDAMRNFLLSKGCHQFQGYLFSRPLPLHALQSRYLTGQAQPVKPNVPV
ncbi:putative bifunctional diguanylate cyclase/phosphodiesterase [Sedimenticola hydrogenitrophicus]|uniref:putative bifunctional diguanylate cyclase/phosphodiesterase n=1 Tax=Sedimenticola hydrogenitrophicus TaxID=2967975 RepID=UPI0023B185A8|nr:GGDEF domain-containing phosphodiesterase [Sedimenticola hydrogenitrophicus]